MASPEGNGKGGALKLPEGASLSVSDEFLTLLYSNVYCALGEKVRIFIFRSYQVRIFFLKWDRDFFGQIIKFDQISNDDPFKLLVSFS